MAIYSRSFIQNTYCGWFWIRKNKCIIECDKNQPDIDKTYQCLISKPKKVGLDHFNHPKAFMEYSNDMQDVYKNIQDCNPDKKRKSINRF